MEKIQKILLNEQFKFVNINNWVKATYYYTIDSKYRTKRKIDWFLANQLEDPSHELKMLAYSLRGKNKATFQEDTIINILKWVLKNIKYLSDIVNFGKVEYWAFAEETIEKGKDDCDGMNALIYILARLAGIDEDQLYCMIGKVKLSSGKLGGHFWLSFWSTEYDRLVVIDATYYPNTNQIKDRPKFTLTEAGYQKISYAFNEKITLKIS